MSKNKKSQKKSIKSKLQISKSKDNAAVSNKKSKNTKREIDRSVSKKKQG
jgi:hypothetical protein